MTATTPTPSRADRLRVVAWPLVATLVIAVFALLRMWQLAIPVAPDVVCAAIMPPPAGCAGDARIMPAAIWSGIVAVASIANTLLGLNGRVARQGVWAGVAITGALALFGIRAVEHLPGM